MQERLMQAGQYGRRFMELGEMYERTAVDARMSEEERVEEMTRLLHLMRRRLDEAAGVLEQTPDEVRELVAA